MKYAVFGDIHGNLEALEAVLEDADNQKVDRHVCLGDIVGYGANPKECIERVQELHCPVVKGNHDEDASTLGPLYGRSELAQAAMIWTRDQLDKIEKQWLEQLPFQRMVEGFNVVHASLSAPQTWDYVLTEFKAKWSFENQIQPVCFIGHTHQPITYTQNSATGVIEYHHFSDFAIEPGKHFLINVGSTGQPRDGDWRSSYAIFDSEKDTVEMRRVAYDIDTTCVKILRAGLPNNLAKRLRLGK